MRQFTCKLVLFLSGSAALLGCGVPGIPKPPTLDLPEPVTDLRAVRKGDRVYLDWTVPTETTDRLAVRHLGSTLICRSPDAAINECVNPAGKVPAPLLPARPQQKTKSAKPTAKIQANYVDSLPRTILGENPSSKIFYAISVPNENGRSAGFSNIVHVPAVAALPPPSDFRAQVTPEGVVLSWNAIPNAPERPGLGHAYRVYRRQEGGNTDSLVGDVPPDITQLVDHTFEWEKRYFYRATVVTLIREEKSEAQFEGDDTPAVKVFAHDVFPPAVPAGLQAVFSGVGQQPFIDLIWAPDTDADLAGYNVFRHEAGAEPVKINSELVKAPAFRDMNVSPGKTYIYSVSAVDVRGNESARSQEASETVPQGGS
jgi:hypothetical protein